MPFRPSRNLPEFADLKGILAQSKDTDNALYQTIQEIIERLTPILGSLKERISAVEAGGGGGGGTTPPGPPGMDLDYLGDFVSGPVYNDGDIVVGADGILYMCVKDGTVTPPEPFPTTPPGPHHTTHETGGADAITQLAASVINSGVLSDARLSGNVALRNINNNFSVGQTINGGLAVAGAIGERGRPVPLGEWATYTPAWISTGTAPAIGNGVLTGRYTLVGKTCHFKISLVANTTTTFGTGQYFFGLPVAGANPGFNLVLLGNAYTLTGGANYRTDGAIYTNDFSNVSILFTGFNTVISNTYPATFANGDLIRLAGSYETT